MTEHQKEILEIWEFAVEFMQVPIILIIVFLSSRAIRVMELPSLRFVSIAFAFNLLYIGSSIWSSEYAAYFQFENTDFTRYILEIVFDVISYSFFYWGAFEYWINNKYIKSNRYDLRIKTRHIIARSSNNIKIIVSSILTLISAGIIIHSLSVGRSDSENELRAAIFPLKFAKN